MAPGIVLEVRCKRAGGLTNFNAGRSRRPSRLRPSGAPAASGRPPDPARRPPAPGRAYGRSCVASAIEPLKPCDLRPPTRRAALSRLLKVPSCTVQAAALCSTACARAARDGAGCPARERGAPQVAVRHPRRPWVAAGWRWGCGRRCRCRLTGGGGFAGRRCGGRGAPPAQRSHAQIRQDPWCRSASAPDRAATGAGDGAVRGPVSSSGTSSTSSTTRITPPVSLSLACCSKSASVSRLV